MSDTLDYLIAARSILFECTSFQTYTLTILPLAIDFQLVILLNDSTVWNYILEYPPANLRDVCLKWLR